MAFNAAASGGRFASLFPAANQDFPRAVDFMGAGFSSTLAVPALPTEQNASALFPIPTSAGRTVVDMFSNNTISYHFITECKRLNHPKRKRDVKDPNIGEPMFVKRNELDKGPHVVLLQTMKDLNETLAQEVEEGNPTKLEEVFQQWNFIGIVRNEVMRRANYMQNRMFNVTVGLRASALADTWANDDKKKITPRAKLFFGVRKNDKGHPEVYGVIDPPADQLRDCVYAGFVHTFPKQGGRSWPSDEVFEMFVRG